MSILDLQGMRRPTRWDHDEDSNVSIGCDGESGLSVLCE
ncbi:MAG TPA: class III lanthipeptide [Trebonia sp.]|jgi:hypothetical protein|nr:class III lanthipeptide [Trebonia sp.]